MKYGWFFFAAAGAWLLLAGGTWWLHRGRTGSSRWRSWATNAAVALLALLAPLVVAEGALFLFVDTTDSGMLTLTSTRWAERHLPRPAGTFRGRTAAGEAGLPGPRFSVAVIGDSITFGQGVERDEDLYSSVLERGLRARGIAADVRNFSRPGWNTGEELSELRWQFQRGALFHAVVLGFTLNDIGSLVGVPPAFIVATRRLRKPPAALAPLVNRSFLASLLYNRYVTLTTPVVKKVWDEVAESYRKPEVFGRLAAQLREIQRLAESRGVPLVVLTLPSTSIPWDRYPYRDIHRKLDEFWKGMGVTNVDLLPVLEGHAVETLQAGFLDTHPNELAHRLAGEALVPALAGIRERSRAAGAAARLQGRP